MDTASHARYYDRYWSNHAEALNPHEIARIAEIIRRLADVMDALPKHQRATICDLGCGRGWVTDILSRFGDVVGVDFSADAIARARASYPHAEFVCANVLEFAPQRQFDLVVSSEVIEHLEEQERYVRVIAENLAPRGFLILTCPNALQQRRWDRVNSTRQPVENWLSPARLRAILSPHFDILDQSTFYLYFTLHGLRRVINAEKVRAALSSMRLLAGVEGLRHSSGGGLYQIVVARKRYVGTAARADAALDARR